MKYQKLFIRFFIFSICFMLFAGVAAARQQTEILASLELQGNPTLKSIRKDIRKGVYTVKSGRPAGELPDLRFFRYKVRHGDTFWKILSRTSLDMDTLITVNNLASQRDMHAGQVIYIPNMRGIVIKGSSAPSIEKLTRRHGIKAEYIYSANRSQSLDKKYIFIPCARISNLERSLFIGTGFMTPLRNGKKSSGFGTRKNPFNRRLKEFHPGIDYACPLKTRVFAAREGRVIFSGHRGNYGRLVVIRHDHGYSSLYGHLSRTLVRPGQRVKCGECIALSGNSGRSTGPHLHFELRKGNRPVNPGALMRH